MSLSIPFRVGTITTSGTIKNEHFQLHITSQYLASMHAKTCITCWTSMNTSMDSCLVVLDSSISCCCVSYVTAVSGSKPGRRAIDATIFQSETNYTIIMHGFSIWAYIRMLSVVTVVISYLTWNREVKKSFDKPHDLNLEMRARHK